MKNLDLGNTKIPAIHESLNDTEEGYVRKQEQITSTQTKVKKEPKSFKEPFILYETNSGSVVQNIDANVSLDNEQWDRIMALNILFLTVIFKKIITKLLIFNIFGLFL